MEIQGVVCRTSVLCGDPGVSVEIQGVLWISMELCALIDRGILRGVIFINVFL